MNYEEKWKKIPLTIKVSLAYAICGTLQNCLSFITLPLFTRLLSTEQYGQATVYSAWSSILVIFLTLELPFGSFSRAMVKFEKNRDEYIASVEGICLLLSIIFLAIYIPFNAIWENIFELPLVIMIIMVGEILANTAINLWSGKKRFEFRYKEVIAVTLISSIISPIIQYIFVINTNEEKGFARIIGSAVVPIFIGGALFIKSIIKGKHIFNKDFWKYALGYNIPLLAYYLSQIIFNTSDRIMISQMCGTDKAAIYGVAYSLAIILNFVLAAINNSYIPWFYEKLKEGKQRDNRIVANAISIMMSVLLLGVIWFSPEIICIIAGKKYADAKWIVPPVAMSELLLFYSQLCINFEFFFEKKKELINASIGAALTNVVLNVLLIPLFGYYVAGYTTLFSYLIFAGANYYAIKKILKEKRISSHGFDIKALLTILVAFIALGFAGMALYSFWIMRLAIAVVVLVVLFVNYKKFLNYWRIIKGGNK